MTWFGIRLRRFHFAGRADHAPRGTYTIADMALWGWPRMVPFALGDDALTGYSHLKRLVDEISGRPAAARALAA